MRNVRAHCRTEAALGTVLPPSRIGACVARSALTEERIAGTGPPLPNFPTPYGARF
jgi:hypothetical protein